MQKREEAQVNFTVTEPSIKIVEYASPGSSPVFPNRKLIYLLALIFGILTPFSIFYIYFLLDTKIHNESDLIEQNFTGALLGQIPLVDKNTVIESSSSRDIATEAFRMLMSNLKYISNESTKSKVILVTSSIKGEGKTFCAYNLSLSLSSVGKKVLVIGCDLRNPQLHKFIDEEKNQSGLVNFLVDTKFDYKKHLKDTNPNFPSHKMLLSGVVPPNPYTLINNDNLKKLLDDAKENFDYIILDTAPTLLVADTNALFKHSDMVIYVCRSNLTEKLVTNHINRLEKEMKKPFGLVLNGVGQTNAYNYAYGYKYSYGYNYRYSYNYGYGYGYSESEETEK